MVVSFVFSANQKAFVICTRVTSLQSCYTFCTHVTEELHSFLSQSELNNFFVYIIIIVIEFIFRNKYILDLRAHFNPRLPARCKIQSTPGNSNLPLTRSNFHFPSGRFLYNWTLDNSNLFLFPLTVRIIGS